MNIRSAFSFGTIMTMVLFLSACHSNSAPQTAGPSPSVVLHPEWQSILDSCGVTGTTVLYFPNENVYHALDSSQLKSKYVVASTFKIFNSLVSLETGVVKDENEILKWDSVTRWVGNWNHDQGMKEAFANSTVWFYQECARRVGENKMKNWLVKANYGASDISKGIDQFWLNPGFELSPLQQIDFLIRLQKNDLPFSQRSMDIVKNIMVRTDVENPDTIHAKTGWFKDETSNTGWYVGWVERNNVPVFFATCVHQPEPSREDFPQCRIDITRKVLQSMNVISQNRR